MPTRVGVDIGGTFTDFVVYDSESGTLESFKRLSTPHAPEAAVLEGLAGLSLGREAVVVHGSTVATNAVLERKGARTAFVSTAGFRDLLTIGRQNRESLYDLMADRPDPLVERSGCFEVAERVDRAGQVETALEPSVLADLVEAVKAYGADSAAICLLFSFLYPEHERQIAAALRGAGLSVSASSELLPEFREYERASTTALNAYVMPVMDRYLGTLEAGLGEVRLQVMQSNGGRLSGAQARHQPARAILSGPAGGVVGAVAAANAAGFPNLIAFDMGGTSTDVSLAAGKPRLTSEGQIDGLPLRLPMLDIHTIGAGGGSIAWLDRGGSLRVGPESAGASPGPACYGLGGEAATVTDANLVLGRLIPERFLGGELRLDPAAAQRVTDRLGADLGLAPGPARAIEAARAVVRVVNAQMARAIRLVSVERGHDPRGFALVSFGGAGGLHASELARQVGIRTVLIPRFASTLSALGMLVAEPSRDFVRTVMRAGDTSPADLEPEFEPLAREGRRVLAEEGVPPEQIEVERSLDLRYRGQSYELNVAFVGDFTNRFHAAHERAYGYRDSSLPTEIVNLRLRAIGRVERPRVQAEPAGAPDPSAARLGLRAVCLEEADPTGAVPAFDGSALRPGHELDGPALAAYRDTTVLLQVGDRARVDGFRNLVLEVGG